MNRVITERQRTYMAENIDKLYEAKTAYDIRVLAKALGVQSPTAKKKEENWQNIKEILEGKTEAKYSKNLEEKEIFSYKEIVSKWFDELFDMQPLVFEPGPTICLSHSEFKIDYSPEAGEPVQGWLDIIERGYGFLRTGGADVFVDGQIIQNYRLRQHDIIMGVAKKEDPSAKSAKLKEIVRINFLSVKEFQKLQRPRFEDIRAIFPNERLRLESEGTLDFSLRAIDLVAPLGKGQRSLIVSPPKAGKTTLLKQIARSLLTNYPKLTVIILLIDERPEEVTDMQDELKDCFIISSTFDQDQEHHVKVAQETLGKAKRLVESGNDVVILLDSITRLARAYNQVGETYGRTLSGGLDVAALKEPKKFFGAARNTKEGGTLTIIATALVGTGSRMDDVIYEEFKGTGNMEIHLDRKLSERRIYPAIDLEKSGTRREDLLYNQRELTNMWAIRKALSKTDNGEGVEKILELLTKTKTNEEFFEIFEASMQNK